MLSWDIKIVQWAHLGDYFIGCPLISSMPLWILVANMCPLYLIVQWQQIYVAKLQKSKPNPVPPPTADMDQGNMEFSCLRWTIIISRLKLPVFVFGHFSHFIPTLTDWCSSAFAVLYWECVITSPPIPESSQTFCSSTVPSFPVHFAFLRTGRAFLASRKLTWLFWTTFLFLGMKMRWNDFP